jgi:hypothetical protein
MYDRLRRYSVRSARLVAWLPLLFVGAMLFWTIALGLGGLSLMAVTALSSDCGRYDLRVGPGPTATEPMPGMSASSDGIVVRLEESAEPEDVNDNAGADVQEPGEETADNP